MGMSDSLKHEFATNGATFRRVVLRDGAEVFVNERAAKRGNTGSDDCTLVIHSDAMAEVRPKPAFRVFATAFLIVGLILLAMAITQRAEDPGKFVPMLILSVGLATGGLLGVLGVIGPKLVVIDRGRGYVVVPKGRVPLPELRAGLPLSRVGALQLCYWIHHVQRKNRHRNRHRVFNAGFDSKLTNIYNYRDSETVTMFELNMVLRGGNGERFTLMTSRDPANLEYQAKQLAAMLNLPLIDSLVRSQT
ncbi:MAG: hypothetical protein FWE88_08240 [Phycisphaerae bacterium]|nr:hypothetical protein [Phycisphaerae bacterium]